MEVAIIALIFKMIEFDLQNKYFINNKIKCKYFQNKIFRKETLEARKMHLSDKSSKQTENGNREK